MKKEICEKKTVPLQLVLVKSLVVTVRFSFHIFLFHSAPEEGLYCKPKYRAILFKIIYCFIPFYFENTDTRLAYITFIKGQ